MHKAKTADRHGADRDLVDGAFAGQTPIMNGAHVRDLWFNTTMDWSTDVVRAVAGPLMPARFAGRGRATVDVRQNRLSIVRVEPLLHSWPANG